MQSRCASARQQFGFDFSLLFLLWLGLGCRGGVRPPLVVHFPTPPPQSVQRSSGSVEGMSGF